MIIIFVITASEKITANYIIISSVDEVPSYICMNCVRNLLFATFIMSHFSRQARYGLDAQMRILYLSFTTPVFLREGGGGEGRGHA